MAGETFENITKLERDVVIKAFGEQNIPLTITMQRSPNHNYVYANEFFPVVLSPDSYKVMGDGSGLIRKSIQDAAMFVGKECRVEFYFNKLGLFFNTKIVERREGYFFSVPEQITRIHDPAKETAATDLSFKASLSFAARGNSSVSYECIPPCEDYGHFRKPVFSDIPVEFQSAAKNMLGGFIADAKKSMAPSIGNGLHLIPICRYLVTPLAVRTVSFQGRVEPMDIIFVDEQRFVAATGNTTNLLELEGEYVLTFEFDIRPEHHLKRTIKIPCTVENIYSAQEKKCFVCRYLGIKAEDSRFIMEKKKY
ncbi:MAG: hypothetical protein J6W63_00090 [Treponema sp.]|nr:hypothetical protein [Treponema sp.]